MNESDLLQAVGEGLKDLLSKANLPFMALNTLWIFIIRMTGEKSFKKATPSKLVLFLRRIPKAYFVIIQSALLALIWAYLFRYNTREQTAELFFSITFSMIVWKMGVEKIIKLITKK